ncbi:NAD dependent epimerase/dehydratase family [Stigmatella aurantiaca DW4/3-1]|nr:NAD dependent epimerase/dehydratase family [Stigmatella aurantiaca DW4/3-1]
MVTGAGSGIGLQLTLQLLAEGAHVVALMRRPFGTEPELVRALKEGRLRYYPADLSNEASLRQGAEAILRHEKRLDVLFNNAGVAPATLQFSAQGRELNFEVNTVAPYVLTQRLRPLLARAGARVVNVSSNALLTVKRFHPDELLRPSNYRKLFGPYAASKLALSLWTEASAEAFVRDGIQMVSVCPGGNRTPMTGSAGMPFWLLPISRFFFAHPREGARRVLAAARIPELPAGAFVLKGRTKPLPFREHAQTVFDLVDGLFRQSLAAAP